MRVRPHGGFEPAPVPRSPPEPALPDSQRSGAFARPLQIEQPARAGPPRRAALSKREAAD